MNPSDTDLPEVPDADAGPLAAADKPKRKRAPRKTAADAAPAAAEDAPAQAAAPDGAAPAEPAPAPAPRRRRAAAVAAPAEDGASAAAATSAPLVAAPAQAPMVEAVAAAAPAGAAAATGSETPAETRGQGQGEGRVEAGAEGEERGRRGRNRRRGRRGGARDGVVGEEGDAALAGAVPGRAPQPVAEEVFAQVLAGEFDVEPGTEAGEVAAALASEAELAGEAEGGIEGEGGDADGMPKRVLAAEADAPKLHKVLAQAGVGSRRDLENMIAEGRFTVNDEPAHVGQRVSFGDRIALDGKPVRYRIAPPPPRVLAYHKPAGEVVTHDDPQQRPTVFRRLPRLHQGKWQSVGRLDINTEGLLLFTTSGELANQLMHPRFGVEREYAVRSLGVLGADAKARLLEGVDIDGQRCAFKSIALRHHRRAQPRSATAL